MHPIFYMIEKEFIQHKIVTRLPLFVFLFVMLLLLPLLVLLTVAILHNSGFNTDVEVSRSALELSTSTGSGLIKFQKWILATISFGPMIVSFLLSTLYLSKAICKDRQEGCIAFWRSMPISDLAAHLTKLGFALLVIPMVCSLLVLSAGLFLWLLSLITPGNLSILTGNLTLFSVLNSYFSFLVNMFVIAIALLPFACVIFTISQLSDSPLLITLIAIYALKIACGTLLPLTGLDQFFYQFIHLPTSLLTLLLFTDEPMQLIDQLPILPTVAMYALAGIFFIVNLSIQKHGELRINNPFTAKKRVFNDGKGN